MKMYFIWSQYRIKKKVMIVKCSRSNDQDDRHAKNAENLEKIFLSRTTGPIALKLGM